jgi:predicted dehydrogenase
MKDSFSQIKDSRRQFIRKSTWASISIMTLPNVAKGTTANSKLRFACIGAGGRASAGIGPGLKEHLVAIAEPDLNGRGGKEIKKAKKAQSDVKIYTDYRELFDKHDDLDAVWIGCPDHNHFGSAMLAMEMGAAVYCEKPLTWSIGEAATLRATAAEKKIVTQMGNQGHSSDSIRKIVEHLRGESIGPVKKVVSHMGKKWGATGMPPKAAKPSGLDWEAWLGPAREAEYRKDLHPFNWRKYGPFGTGTLGDMACHTIDGAVWGLRLTEVDTFQVEAEKGGASNGGHALDAVVRWDFPARGDMPAMSLWWYQGNAKPERPEEAGKGVSSTLYHGEKGFMTSGSHCQGVKMMPETFAKTVKEPKQLIARVPGHTGDWIRAIKDSSAPAPCSHFGYSAKLTEIVLAGVAALAVGEKLTFDLKKSRFVNNEKANALLWRKPRKGWEFGYPA